MSLQSAVNDNGDGELSSYSVGRGNDGCGAGHGGMGGTMDPSERGGGMYYGSVVEPVYWGSVGKYLQWEARSYGGGVLRLECEGDITVDGKDSTSYQTLVSVEYVYCIFICHFGPVGNSLVSEYRGPGFNNSYRQIHSSLDDYLK